MKNKTAAFEQIENALSTSSSGELLLWFLQKFRTGNNFQRLIISAFATLSGLAMFQASLAVFCAAMFFFQRNPSANWTDGVVIYGGQACILSAYALVLFVADSTISNLKQK